MKIEDITTEYVEKIAINQKVYLTGMLNDSHIRLLKKYFSYDIQNDPYIAYISTGIINTGKSGLLFTKKGFIYKDWGIQPVKIIYEDINNIELIKKKNKEVINLHLKDGNTAEIYEQLFNMKEFHALINDVLKINDVVKIANKIQKLKVNNQESNINEQVAENKHINDKEFELIDFSDVDNIFDIKLLHDEVETFESKWNNIDDLLLKSSSNEINIGIDDNPSDTEMFDINKYFTEHTYNKDNAEHKNKGNISTNNDGNYSKELPAEQDKESENLSPKLNYIEELKLLKELLDSGILTQEEFDEKKKQILNI